MMSSIMIHKISNYLACFYADFCLLKYETAPNWMVFWKYFPKGKREKEKKKEKKKIESAKRKNFIVKNEGKKQLNPNRAKSFVFLMVKMGQIFGLL